MPGGHITYIGLLTKLLLKHLPVNYDYIHANNSVHNVNMFFPTPFQQKFNWETWIKDTTEKYAYQNVCVIKDSWGKLSFNEWGNNLNATNNAFCLVSSPVNKVDWYYSWLSYKQKCPGSLYGYFRTRNPMLPIWHLLKFKHKRDFLFKSMPIFPIKENLNLTCSNFKFPTTHILTDDFPSELNNFLNTHNFDSSITEDIINFHRYFVSKQKLNYDLSLKLANNEKWQPRDIFDKLLFEWMDTNPWEELK